MEQKILKGNFMKRRQIKKQMNRLMKGQRESLIIGDYIFRKDRLSFSQVFPIIERKIFISYFQDPWSISDCIISLKDFIILFLLMFDKRQNHKHMRASEINRQVNTACYNIMSKQNFRNILEL